MFRVKRIYESPAEDDGYRVLVDRLWPRGMKREAARIDAWLKHIAPSDGLRKAVQGGDIDWAEFVARYRMELATPEVAATLADLRSRSEAGVVTLLFAKADVVESNATVLREVLAEGG
jgi:uncharacterized protein YeaO (DUF488 family)